MKQIEKKTPTFKFGNDSFKQTWKSLMPSNKTLNEKKKQKTKTKQKKQKRQGKKRPLKGVIFSSTISQVLV